MRLFSRDLSRGAILTATVLVATTLLFLFALSRGDDDPTSGPNGLSNRPARTLADDTSVSSIGTCLSPGVSLQEKNELIARLEEAGRTDEYADTSVAPIEISLEQATSIVDRETPMPEAPEGWRRTLYLRSLSERSPVEQCFVEIVVRDPSVSEVLTFPEERGLTHEGDPYVSPEYTITVYKQAVINVFESAPPLALPISDSAEISYRWTDVQGQKTLLSADTFDEPSVTLGWDQGGLRIFMACSLMTVEECQSIAETVK